MTAFTIPAQALAKALAIVSAAMERDTEGVRAILAGVHWSVQDNGVLRLIATDASVLSAVTISYDAEETPPIMAAVYPAPAMLALKKLAALSGNATAEVDMGDGSLSVAINTTGVVCKALAGKVPDYQKAIDAARAGRLETAQVRAEDLARWCADHTGEHTVSLQWSHRLHINADRQNALELGAVADAPPVLVAPALLWRVLTPLSGTITLATGAPNVPILIKTTDTEIVVMPMCVGWRDGQKEVV